MSRARIIGGTAALVAALAAPMGAYYEGVHPVGYADPVSIPTDCIGETGPEVRIGVQRYSFDECVARYEPRLQRVWDDGLSRCITNDVTVYEGAALVSWADNVGIRAACTSTLVRLLNAGAASSVWCAQLARWDNVKRFGIAITLRGLTRRRAAEREMCMGRDWRAVVVQFARRAGWAPIARRAAPTQFARAA